MTKKDKKLIVTSVDQTMMEEVDEIIKTTGITKAGFVRRAIQHEIDDGMNALACVLALVELQNEINKTVDYLPEKEYKNLQIAINNVTKCMAMEGDD